MKRLKNLDTITRDERNEIKDVASHSGKRGARAVLRSGVSVSEFGALLKGKSATPGTVRAVCRALGVDEPESLNTETLREPNRSRRERVRRG